MLSGFNIKFGVFVIESSLILSAIPMNVFGWIVLSWFKLKTSIWSKYIWPKSISGMNFIEQFEMSNIQKCFSLDDLFNHLAKQGLYLTLK